MGIMTNSEDPDEMPHDAAFHQGLYTVYLNQKDLQRRKFNFLLEILRITCDPVLYPTHYRSLYNVDQECGIPRGHSIMVYTTWCDTDNAQIIKSLPTSTLKILLFF